MSEESVETSAPAEKEKPWRKKGQRLQPRTRRALEMFLEQERFIKNPDEKTIARECGIAYGTLRQTIMRFRKGLIDLGPAPSSEEKQISMKSELLRSADLLLRADKFLNDMLESQLVRAEEGASKGKYETFLDLRMDRTISMIAQVNRIRLEKERGFLVMLEHAQAAQGTIEKSGEIRSVSDIPVKLSRSEEDRQLLDSIRDAEILP